MTLGFYITESLEIEDTELTDLLTEVYVGGNFIDTEQAQALFEASTVRSRGILIGIRERKTAELAGVITLVPPNSKAIRLSIDNEAEIQLLGVKAKYRKQSLGKRLVTEILNKAKSNGYSKIILWTQETMLAAQRLYESFGFVQINHFEKNGRVFFVYCLEF